MGFGFVFSALDTASQKNEARQFPGGPAVRTRGFHHWGPGFNPGSGDEDPASHPVGPKRKSVWPYHHVMSSCLSMGWGNPDGVPATLGSRGRKLTPGFTWRGHSGVLTLDKPAAQSSEQASTGGLLLRLASGRQHGHSREVWGRSLNSCGAVFSRDRCDLSIRNVRGEKGLFPPC